MAENAPPANEKKISGRPLRIEMVLARLYVGGMEVMVFQLMKEMRRRGHEVGLTCIEEEGTLYDAVRDDGFNVQVVRAPGIKNLLSPRPLSAWFQKIKPDVVHIHSGAWIKAAVAARRAGVPRVVYTHHGLEGRESIVDAVLNRYAARYTDRMVAVSEELRDRMHAEGGLRQHTIQVLPNGVPTETFTPDGPAAGLRQRFGIPHDGFVIGNVARMWPIKNQVGLVNAFALLRKDCPNAYLVIVGDGHVRPDIENRIAELQLENSVFLAGEMAGLESVFREFDLFALSSFSEGMSISILEAMASGTCVVATAVGGNPHLLGHGKFGLLVPDSNPEAFADAMRKAMDDDALTQRLSSAARTQVLDNFSVGAMGDAYETVYRAQHNESASTTSATKEDPACVG